MSPITDHPAKWSKSVLAQILLRCAAEAEGRPGRLVALDPFAGVGLDRLRGALPEEWLLLGTELEPEWATAAEGSLVADACRLPLRPGSVDVLVSSPDYGNRMADSYDGSRDRCQACRRKSGGSSGCRVPDCEALHLMPVPPGSPKPHGPCEVCSGSGRSPSKRYTYRISLGRPLSEANGARLHWHADKRGDPYRDLHRRAWNAAWEALAPGALILVNVSNFPKTVGPKGARRQEIQHVVEWHLSIWLRLGALIESVARIQTPRMGHGQNHKARVDGEHLLILRRPA